MDVRCPNYDERTCHTCLHIGIHTKEYCDKIGKSVGTTMCRPCKSMEKQLKIINEEK